MQIEKALFLQKFDDFCALVAKAGDRPFTNFQEGFLGAWENYKPRLNDRARQLLDLGAWAQEQVGSGMILDRVIDAIEIHEPRLSLDNNLLLWQNRYGHISRDHHALLDAKTNAKVRRTIEQDLFSLFVAGGDEAKLFESLAGQTGRKYPLMAYLFFLKDMNRFMPIQPTGFDIAFRELGIDLVTVRNCNWSNYNSYMDALESIRRELEILPGLKNIPLIDAHSFCWIYRRLLKRAASGDISGGTSKTETARIFSGRERAVIEMRMSVEATVSNSNGQTALQTIKNKELRMTRAQLEKMIQELIDRQEDRCALTGLRLEYDRDADLNLRPSLDRIDSDGHYEEGNLQIVCRFINFWKGSSDNSEFSQLLNLVRGLEIE